MSVDVISRIKRGYIMPTVTRLLQLTGIEDNQCRKARIQCNHICCSILVWMQLAQSKRLKQTLYQVKKGLLSNYLREQLRSPSVKFA